VRSSERSTLARIAPFLVLAVSFLAYAAVSSFGFVYDDEGQIIHDSFVQHWRFFPAYFVSHVWQYVVPHALGNYYRPVFLTWLLLNFKLFGLHAAGWHLAVVFLHLIVTWQVYRLALVLLDNQPAALVTAALFGLHPVHIEAVAWVSGATEPLAAVFVLGSLLSYIAYRKQGRHTTYVLALLCFTLAVLTKETAVLLPVVLFAYDLLLRGQQPGPGERIRGSFLRLVPFGSLVGVYLIARYHALHALTRQIVNIDARTTLLTIPSVLAFYARLLLLPVRLSAFYDTPYITTAPAALWPAIGCVVVAGIAVALLWRFRSRAAGFAVVLLLFPLLPLMKLSVFPQGELAHDRYLYLPSIGFALLLGLLAQVIAKNSRPSKQRVWTACAGILCILYFYGTLTQSLYWANDLVLYVRGVQLAPNNLVARTDLGAELMARGRTDLAMDEYRNVLHRDPQYWLARYNLGYAEYATNDCASAAHDLEIAAAEVPTDAESMFYLGHCRFQLGDRRTGIALMRRGIQLDPRIANFRAQLADDLVLTDVPENLRTALQLYRTEAAANPAHPTAARRAEALAARLDVR